MMAAMLKGEKRRDHNLINTFSDEKNILIISSGKANFDALPLTEDSCSNVLMSLLMWKRSKFNVKLDMVSILPIKNPTTIPLYHDQLSGEVKNIIREIFSILEKNS